MPGYITTNEEHNPLKQGLKLVLVAAATMAIVAMKSTIH